jgi:short-subunit dehydrogenase
MTARKPSFLILGAASDIGGALADVASAAGCSLVLAARRGSQLAERAELLRREHQVSVATCDFDVLDTDGHSGFLDGLPYIPDIVVCVVGLLGEQTSAERSFAAADLIIRTNLNGPVSILSEVANRMEQRGHGAIIGVSSVAGDRGRAENYIYGTAKAGLSTFLSGLRQRLYRTPVRIVTVKPGMVRTKMTAGRSGPLMTTPDRIAPSLLRACFRGRGVVYLPWYWRPIMFLIRAIPESLFRRISIRGGR